MKLVLKTAPAVEPVDLLSAKAHLRIDSTDLDSDITSTQSIAPGAHIIAANYTLVGTGVYVLGSSALVVFEMASVGAGGTVDVKIQESNVLGSGYTDWTGGSFTTVNSANDEATFTKTYTGTKAYIRAVSTVAGATCSFGVSVVVDSPVSNEDTLLSALITTARQFVENLTGPLITQTWYQYEDDWPAGEIFPIGKPRLQSITSVSYTDEDSVSAVFPSSNYTLDDKDKWKPSFVLKEDSDWPSDNLFNVNPIVVEFLCGYGAAGSDVPEPIRAAIKIMLTGLYQNRAPSAAEMGTIDILLGDYRWWGF